MSLRLLLLEDDKELGSLLKKQLSDQGYSVNWAESLKEARRFGKNFDLGILDLFLPDGKGFELAKDLGCPVIMMSAMSDPENRLQGAEIGVIDFIPKPFLVKELLIKAEKALGQKIIDNQIWQFDQVRLDLNKKIITNNENTFLLNKRDSRLLEILSQKAPKVVDRDTIIDYLYGEDQNPSQRTVDNAILSVRQMLNDDGSRWIRSIRGEGYQWIMERK